MNIHQRDAIEEPSSILDNISLSTHCDKEFTQPPFSIHNEYYFQMMKLMMLFNLTNRPHFEQLKTKERGI